MHNRESNYYIQSAPLKLKMHLCGEYCFIHKYKQLFNNGHTQSANSFLIIPLLPFYINEKYYSE